MGSESSDRARMRDDLRELARMATSDAPSTPHVGLATADSSGYVDLSALTAADDAADGAWVERELARAGARPRAPALAPGSMAPVAIASLLKTDPDIARTKSKKRGWVYSGLILAGAGVVAVLAVAVTRNAPLSLHRSSPANVPAPAVAAAPPPVATEAPAAPVPTETATAVAAVIPPKAPPVSDTAPAKKATSSRARVSASPAPPPAAHAAVAATPRPPAAVAAAPAKKGGSGGDSLMDMMRASVGTAGKK